MKQGLPLAPEMEIAYAGFEKQYHASGHASGEDITWAIDQIDPDHIVPILTEARDWFVRSFENVVMVNEGQPYEF